MSVCLVLVVVIVLVLLILLKLGSIINSDIPTLWWWYIFWGWRQLNLFYPLWINCVRLIKPMLRVTFLTDHFQCIWVDRDADFNLKFSANGRSYVDSLFFVFCIFFACNLPFLCPSLCPSLCPFLFPSLFPLSVFLSAYFTLCAFDSRKNVLMQNLLSTATWLTAGSSFYLFFKLWFPLVTVKVGDYHPRFNHSSKCVSNFLFYFSWIQDPGFQHHARGVKF